MTFGTAWWRSFTEAWRFIVALPLVALLAIGVEGLQHLVEWQGGMYASRAGAVADADSLSRLAAGTLKVVWLNVIQFWVVRYMISGGTREALDPEPVAVNRFGRYMVFSVVLTALTFWPPALTHGHSFHRAATIAASVLGLVTIPLGVFVIPWAASAALGDPRASFMFGVHRAVGSILWGIALGLAVALPLLAVHYALGLGAIGQPTPVAIAMLAFDSVFVGFLGVAGCTNGVVIAERMAARAGETLALPRG